MTIHVKFPAQAWRPVGARWIMMKMVMVVVVMIVIKWKMMQQRENKGKCHKMEPDLGLYKNTCHEVLLALLGPA